MRLAWLLFLLGCTHPPEPHHTQTWTSKLTPAACKTCGESTKVASIAACPLEGDPTNAKLNLRKNRTQEPADYGPVKHLDDILALTEPLGAIKNRDAWPPSVEKALQAAEMPILVDGYLLQVRPEGAESCNCHLTGKDDIDWHIWMARHPSRSETDLVVVEITPRVRAHHKTWTLEKIHNLINQGAEVHIGGYLMYDPQHPEQIGKTRATLWEVHPITRIDFFENERWQTL